MMLNLKMKFLFSILILILLCYKTAKAQQNDPICHLNPEAGPCEAIIWKYYYNSTLGKCEKFLYGGCKGNRNRFDSYDKCMAYCDVNGKTKTLLCEESPADPGPCRARIPRFFFNKNTRKCESFVYGGCGGNQNNFRTLEQCNTICNQSEKPKDESICNQNYEVGLCKGHIPRFYFNSTTERCEPFVYGGCGGNSNNFRTLEQCNTICNQSEKPKDESICNQNYEVGLCKGHIPRFYFNSTTGRCEPFVYGGCGGNSNNFKTVEDCEANCGAQQSNQQSSQTKGQKSKKEICNQNYESGQCLAYFRKYYFNSATGQCEEFIYGGCGGNENNFPAKESCEEFCIN